MNTATYTNKELAKTYIRLKSEKKKLPKRQSCYDLNKQIKIKMELSVVKNEMKKRGINKKDAKMMDLS